MQLGVEGTRLAHREARAGHAVVVPSAWQVRMQAKIFGSSRSMLPQLQSAAQLGAMLGHWLGRIAYQAVRLAMEGA